MTSPTMSGSFAPRSIKRKNIKGLAIDPASANVSSASSHNNGNNDGRKLSGEDGDLRTEPGVQLRIGTETEFSYDVKQASLEVMNELGSGSGGTVSKAKHLPTGTIMAQVYSSSRAHLGWEAQVTPSKATSTDNIDYSRSYT